MRNTAAPLPPRRPVYDRLAAIHAEIDAAITAADWHAFRAASARAERLATAAGRRRDVEAFRFNSAFRFRMLASAKLTHRESLDLATMRAAKAEALATLAKLLTEGEHEDTRVLRLRLDIARGRLNALRIAYVAERFERWTDRVRQRRFAMKAHLDAVPLTAVERAEVALATAPDSSALAGLLGIRASLAAEV